MCEYCTKHGEGKKWYLNIENYLEERMSDEHKKYILSMHDNVEYSATEAWATAVATDDPNESVRRLFEEIKKFEWGQVVPLEDVEKIFDLALNIVRVPCGCRTALWGAKEERVCFKVIASPSGFWKEMFDQLPDMSPYLDVLSCEEAKKDFRKFNEGGLVHTVWSYGNPFIGALCNCTPRDCLGMKGFAYGGHRSFLKAEYVAAIDSESCIGCRECKSFCHFDAIKYSSTSEKCAISQLQCFGCGLCIEACPQAAISLIERNKIPRLKNEW